MEDKNDSVKGLLLKAEEAESNDDKNLAIKLYGDILKQDPLHIQSYNSLMKIYRRNKEYKKELSTINAGIKAYEKFYQKHSKKKSDISQKLNKSIGLVDKKGTSVYMPEPIGGWLKRKAVVEKKLK